MNRKVKIMKKLIFFIIIGGGLLFAGSQTAAAQAERRLDSSPAAFRAFFQRFRNAVEKSDKTAVAALTAFPFSYGFDAGDEGKMTRAQFIKRFNEIFGNAPKRFLKERNPLFSRPDRGSYVVSTDEAAHFIFVRTRSGFKFTAYMVEP